VRFTARVPGLASGLALAVGPAGLAEVSGVNGTRRSAAAPSPRRSTAGAFGFTVAVTRQHQLADPGVWTVLSSGDVTALAGRGYHQALIPEHVHRLLGRDVRYAVFLADCLYGRHARGQLT
jgi:hypothetical protein